MSAEEITLYRLQACPFCERVVRKLQDLNVPYNSRFVEPLHSERDVVKRLTGTRTVPAIVDERTGVTMAESANIVDYLEGTYGEDERGDSSEGGEFGDNSERRESDDAGDAEAAADGGG